MPNLTYTYTSAVPQGTQQINNTQSPIENNFEDIAQLIAVNHTPFDTVTVPNATPGLHNLVTYFQQSSDPATSATEMALYSKASTDGNISELFYRYPNNGAVFQLTGSTATSPNTGSGGSVFDNSIGAYQGWQYLSGGLLMKWGGVSPVITGATTTIAFPTTTGVPAFSSTPVNLEVMQWNSAFSNSTSTYRTIYFNTVNATSFSVTFTSPPTGFNIYLYYMAIGV